jgi:hypothetical protein
VRRINDPHCGVFTLKDLASLENPVICGKGDMGTKGAVIITDTSYLPNNNASKSNKIEDEEKFYDVID